MDYTFEKATVINRNRALNIISIVLVAISLLFVIYPSTVRLIGTREIERQLQEKHGEEFTVTNIEIDHNRPVGEWWHTPIFFFRYFRPHTINAVVQSDNHPHLPFVASLGWENRELQTDGYIRRMISSQLENIVNSKFEKNSINLTSIVTSFHTETSPSNQHILLNDLFEQYEPENIHIIGFLSSDDLQNETSLLDKSEFTRALNNIYSEFSSLGFQGTTQYRIFIVSAEEFDEITINQNPDFYITLIHNLWVAGRKEYVVEISETGEISFVDFEM